VEFVTLVRFFFGRKGHIISQLFINVALQATNIAGIVVSTQVMDSMFVDLFHRSCGIAVYPKFEWYCVTAESSSESPFGRDVMLFTIGYLVVMAVIIPLGYLNLDDNIIIQVAAMIFLVGCIVDWIVLFFSTGLPQTVPFTTKNQAGVLGTVMFNFAYITTVPSWVNEKKPSVSIHRSLWSACVASTAAFLFVGYLGAAAYKMKADSDILSIIDTAVQNNKSIFVRGLAHTLVYLFPLMVLATSIPVYSIIVRYNLLQNKVCNKVFANLFAVVFPWVAAIFFMSGDALNNLINWSSYAFGSVANFIIPFIIYIKACNFRLNERERLTEEQHEILLSMHPPKPIKDVESGTASRKNLASAASYKRLPGTSSFKSINASTSSYQNMNNAISLSPDGESSRKNISAILTNDSPKTASASQRNIPQAFDPDAIPTPLPPNFIAIPFTTPQSARWIAGFCVTIMTGLVVGVIILAVAY